MIQLGDASANAFLTDVVSQSQTLGSLNAQVLAQLRGQATATVQVTAIGSQTLIFEGSTDGTNFFSLLGWIFPSGAVPIFTTTTTGQWLISVAGLYQFRVRCSAYTSGSATVSVVCAQGTSQVPGVYGVVAQASSTGGETGPLVQGAVTTAAPVYTTAQTDPLSLTTAGALRIDVNSIIGTTAVASSGGVLKVGIAGGAAGAAIDGAIAAVPPANALQIGIKAATANPANATAGNAVAIMGDKAGRQVVTIGNVRELIGLQTSAIANSAAETTILAAGGAGVFNDISHIDISMTNAGTPAACTVTIKDATAGTTRAIYFLAATAATVADLISIDYAIPMAQSAANANWTATCSSATVTLNFNLVYVKNL